MVILHRRFWDAFVSDEPVNSLPLLGRGAQRGWEDSLRYLGSFDVEEVLLNMVIIKGCTYGGGLG